MSQTLNTPLQLKSLNLYEVHLEKNESVQDVSLEDHSEIGFGLEIQAAENIDNIYRVILTVNITDSEDSVSPLYATIKAGGIFEIPDESEESLSLLQYNGTAQVYGFIRSVLYDLTLKFDTRSYLLPTVNLIPVIDSMIEAEAQDS